MYKNISVDPDLRDPRQEPALDQEAKAAIHDPEIINQRVEVDQALDQIARAQGGALGRPVSLETDVRSPRATASHVLDRGLR